MTVPFIQDEFIAVVAAPEQQDRLARSHKRRKDFSLRPRPFSPTGLPYRYELMFYDSRDRAR